MLACGEEESKKGQLEKAARNTLKVHIVKTNAIKS
jgi:hypothetical protein